MARADQRPQDRGDAGPRRRHPPHCPRSAYPRRAEQQIRADKEISPCSAGAPPPDTPAARSASNRHLAAAGTVPVPPKNETSASRPTRMPVPRSSAASSSQARYPPLPDCLATPSAAPECPAPAFRGPRRFPLRTPSRGGTLGESTHDQHPSFHSGPRPGRDHGGQVLGQGHPRRSARRTRNPRHRRR